MPTKAVEPDDLSEEPKSEEDLAPIKLSIYVNHYRYYCYWGVVKYNTNFLFLFLKDLGKVYSQI